MRSRRPRLFRKRQFEPIIIATCVRWYCRFSLSLRDLEELMAERGLRVDHATTWRWVQRYAPEVHQRLRGNVKPKSSTWHIDETFIRIADRWLYLFRAVDGHGQTVDFDLSEKSVTLLASKNGSPPTDCSQASQNGIVSKPRQRLSRRARYSGRTPPAGAPRRQQ